MTDAGSVAGLQSASWDQRHREADDENRIKGWSRSSREIVGARAVMLGYLPVILLAASTGTWLFYIQHQFEHAYWATAPDWNFDEAALNGSSFYDLPTVLHWLTGYIGFHHIHHVCSKIPNYRLRECFDENPEFRDVRRLTLLDSLKCARLSLWDEERQLLVPFPHAFRRRRAVG